MWPWDILSSFAVDLSTPIAYMEFGHWVTGMSFHSDVFGDKYVVLSRCQILAPFEKNAGSKCKIEFHAVERAQS